MVTLYNFAGDVNIGDYSGYRRYKIPKGTPKLYYVVLIIPFTVSRT